MTRVSCPQGLTLSEYTSSAMHFLEEFTVIVNYFVKTDVSLEGSPNWDIKSRIWDFMLKAFARRSTFCKLDMFLFSQNWRLWIRAVNTALSMFCSWHLQHYGSDVAQYLNSIKLINLSNISWATNSALTVALATVHMAARD